jgi:hypothetical protein
MGRTAYTESQCLYKGDLYLYLLTLRTLVFNFQLLPLTGVVSFHYPLNPAAQLVEALRYKLEGCGFDYRFFIYIILPAALWLWDLLSLLTELSTRNISWGVKAAGA